LCQRQPPQHFHRKAIHGKLLFIGTNATKASAPSGVKLYKDVESGAALADAGQLGRVPDNASAKADPTELAAQGK
jgi:hypothetical protein